MKTPILVVIVFLFLTGLQTLAQKQQVVVPCTLADRYRTIRVEAKMEALEAKMNVTFEAVNARIDYQFWPQGVIVALVLFMIWDRRTALQPALNKANDADAKTTGLIRSLRDYSKKHPDLAEILKTDGIL